jgi:hypothetical protein
MEHLKVHAAYDLAALRPRLLGEGAARHELGGIGRTFFWKLVADGKLEIVRVGRRSLVVSESIDRLIEEARTENNGKIGKRGDVAKLRQMVGPP